MPTKFSGAGNVNLTKVRQPPFQFSRVELDNFNAMSLFSETGEIERGYHTHLPFINEEILVLMTKVWMLAAGFPLRNRLDAPTNDITVWNSAKEPFKMAL